MLDDLDFMIVFMATVIVIIIIIIVSERVLLRPSSKAECNIVWCRRKHQILCCV